MPGVFEALQRKLFNLAGNNRSLFISKFSKEVDIDLREFEFISGLPSYQFIKELIAGKVNIPLCPIADARNGQVNTLSKTLKKIDRKARFLSEERGTQDLFIGYPIIEGLLQEDFPIRTPFLYFPISLESKGNSWVVSKSKEQTPFINKFVLLAYAHYSNMPLPEALWEEDFQEFSEDSTIFRTQLYRFFEDNNLAVHFNQDLFHDELKPLLTLSKDDLKKQYQPGTLKLQQQAVLGIFAMSDLFLINDYDQLAQRYDSIEQVFPIKTKEKASYKEEHFLTCLPSDSPQEICLQHALQGESMVIQGPPGTGKSQFIANLASNLMASGKKVLVVCQKRAALDVVANRLNDLGIADFVSLVHDYRIQLRSIYLQLANQISKISDYQKYVGSLNSVIIEREFLQHCRKLDLLSEAGEAYWKGLIDNSEFGISLAELYGLAQPVGYKPFQISNSIHILSLEDLCFKFVRYVQLWSAAGKLENIYVQKRFSWAENQGTNLPYVMENMRKAREYFHSLSNQTQPYLADFSESYQFIKDVEIGANQIFHSSLNKLVKANTLHDLKLNWARLMQFVNLLQNEESLNYQVFSRLEIDHWHFVSKIIEEKIELGLVNSLFFPLTKKGKILNQSLKSFGYSLKQIQVFETKLRQNILLEELRLCFERIAGNSIDMEKLIQYVPDFQKHGMDWLHSLEKLTQAPVKWVVLEQFWLFRKDNPELFESATKSIQQLKLLFPIDTLDEVWQNDILWKEFDGYMSQYYLEIIKFDDWVVKLSNQELAIFEYSTQVLDFSQGTKVEVEFSNLIYNSWINELEQKFGFQNFDSLTSLEQLSEDLVDGIKKKIPLSNKLLQLKLYQLPINNLEFNRLNNRVTYRALEHEVTKKRKVWPLRKLLDQFSEEVFRLVPCWLTSPEAASAIFPLERVFDVIIFDEASQCYAEKAIPIFERAQQVIVIGDSKQLPPNTLYRVVWEGETEVTYSPENEVDAALDLARFHIPEYMLTWHYRCLHPDLIAFSNLHFYKNKLTVIPQKSFTNLKNRIFEYVDLQGIWKNQTNIEEMQYLVDEAKSWVMDKEADKTIGIVTFNQPQQELISDALIDLFTELNLSWPHWLWVKNIENVQGNEADWIYFSLAYGKDEQGKVKVNFGTLSQAGGEKRLNVAITRAREKIVMVTSLKPFELDVTHSINQGPVLLKKYLEFVFEKSKDSNTKDAEETMSTILNDVNLAEISPNGKAMLGHYPLLMQRRGWEPEWRFSRQIFYSKTKKP